MVNLELIRVIDASGVAGIFETTNDILVVVDRATTVAAATLPFPVNPIRGQLMGISTRIQITSLTLDSGPQAIPISGYTAPFLLAANTVLWWIYEDVANRWFRY